MRRRDFDKANRRRIATQAVLGGALFAAGVWFFLLFLLTLAP